MKSTVLAELKKELVARGFSQDLQSPKETMGFDDIWLREIELGEFLDLMVRRREKAFRSYDVVGKETGDNAYDDLVIAIDAAKAVIARLSVVPDES